MTHIPKVQYIDVRQLVDILALQLEGDKAEAAERRRPPQTAQTGKPA
ncbi:hypothetical protein [Jannaschia sp. 2305UL9-9]